MESIVLTPRLACIASLVPQNARLADIGTDHGKLPIALLKSGQVASAIGSDIGKGPLDHAARNAIDHGVSDHLTLRLAPGLEQVRPEECDTISIAGMGGQTMCEILSAAPWTARGEHLLLLQPMTMIAELRQWLGSHGYDIERETICREEHRRYVVISARGGAVVRHLPLSACAVSEALCAAEHAQDYLQHLLRRELHALCGMKQGQSVEPRLLRQQQDTVDAIKTALEEMK